ncbi:AfsR/SARP family transcriptional regulator [Allokutzneria albata]|uniref:Transcriptional regulatory protein, C terminal n=1 Tax=Allokutzneria albata TaxID=211114 RepID=A0A1G9RUM2_ALLAB|nr:winged helix-turn-helix domain-containing protein [Allokutzneria albata]SDM26195.1 Transcriptional regulatory protein, C terminal [Allokutzneria albata]
MWFGVLGELVALREGRRVELPAGRARGMLTVLLVEANQVVPLRVLSERVWGADPPSRAGNTLRAYASRLREALPDVEIERTGDGYRLTADEDSIDLHRFRALAPGNPAAALELWRGTPLSELDSPWAVETRTALLAERLRAALDDNDNQLRTAGLGGLLPNLLADTEDDERRIGQVLLGLYGDQPAPSGSVPRELPEAPTGFVGRGGELAALGRRFAIQREEGAVTLAVHGQRGVGKSWLALRWAHDNLDRFPDGQCYVDLSGPVTEPPEAAGRSLLVLDNARDFEQLKPFLPDDPACTVIITSRERITTRGAQPLGLEPLGERHARDLLAEHLGEQRIQAERSAVDELLSYCDGLPLSLGVITARARANPGIPLAALATELREYAAQLSWLDADDAELNLRVVLTFNQSPAAPGEPGRLRSLG